MWLKDRLSDLFSLFRASEINEEPAPPPAHPPRRPDQQRRGTLRRAGSLRHNPQWGDEYDEPDNRRSMPVILEETRYSSNNPYRNQEKTSPCVPPRRPRRSYIPDAPYHTDTSSAENPWYDDSDICSLGGLTQCGPESKRSSFTITRSSSGRFSEAGYSTGAEPQYPPGDVLLHPQGELQRRASVRRRPSERYSGSRWSAGDAPQHPPGDVLKNAVPVRNFSRRSIAEPKRRQSTQDPPVLELQHLPKTATALQRSKKVAKKRSTAWDRPLSQMVPPNHRLSWSADGKHIELVRVEEKQEKAYALNQARSPAGPVVRNCSNDDDDSDIELSAVGPMPTVNPERPKCFI